MSLLFQMMLSLDIADISTAIRILISFVDVPFLLKVDPIYLKESTSSRFWSFIILIKNSNLPLKFRYTQYNHFFIISAQSNTRS